MNITVNDGYFLVVQINNLIYIRTFLSVDYTPVRKYIFVGEIVDFVSFSRVFNANSKIYLSLSQSLKTLRQRTWDILKAPSLFGANVFKDIYEEAFCLTIGINKCQRLIIMYSHSQSPSGTNRRR